MNTQRSTHKVRRIRSLDLKPANPTNNYTPDWHADTTSARTTRYRRLWWPANGPRRTPGLLADDRGKEL
jgi:hypothetical protein